MTVSQNVTDIAIIGMAGRFPGARNLDEFWRNLRDGVESIRFLSDEELEAIGVEAETLRDPSYVKASAVMDGIELFDANFFGYTPREAELMDPQHRIFLECAWEALEHAGYASQNYPGAIGVFGGAITNTYLLYNLASNFDLLSTLDQVQIDVNNGADFLSTRASYKLDLKGPSYTIASACSTSLVAVHVACQSLLNEECDIALAGGVSIHVKHPEGYRYMEGGIVSPDGRCRAFDAQASGIIFGSGVGIVALKRLEAALADGDHIHAVVKGTAINNDGSVKVGYTAPGIEGQATVIIEALAVAGVKADTISYIETHGTGTQMGDPIEIRALTKAFRAHTNAKNFCAIGSLKTNIGHLASAAGVAGFIKTILALDHKWIPPSLHFERPSPEIDLSNSPFYVNTTLVEWKTKGKPRRAGVSSFGVGGTNAHAILEEAPVLGPSGPSRRVHLLTIAAKTATALEATTLALANHLQEQPQLNVADVAYTLHVGRRDFSYRRMAVCRDLDDAMRVLETRNPPSVFSGLAEIQDRPVVFMFTGQGAQYNDMVLELYQTEPVFREQIDQCSMLLTPHLGLDLRRLLYPDADSSEEAACQLDQTAVTQPALFVIEYALAQLWLSWGVRPKAMIGHSIGEYVAACLAGVFSLQDALALVAARGRLMQALPAGAMMSVPLPEAELLPLLPPRLSIAAVNAPSLCVVSGPTEALEVFQARLGERGIESRRLRTSHAFHSMMMEPILATFEDQVKKNTLGLPHIPYLSNVTGAWITKEQATAPAYWAQHLRRTVRFGDGVRELMQNPAHVLLEVGPGNTLVKIARQHKLSASQVVALASTRHPDDKQSDLELILTTLGKLWLAGVSIDWAGFHARERRHRLPLPTYPFERQRYWIEPRAQAQRAAPRKKANMAEWFYIPAWKSSPLPKPIGPGALAERPGSWLVFVDGVGLGAEMARRLCQANQRVITVMAGERFQQSDERAFTLDPRQGQDYDALLQAMGELPDRIVHLWSLTAGPGASCVAFFDECQTLGFHSLLFLAQAMGKRNDAATVRLEIVTNHTFSVNETELAYPEKSPLLGACRVIPQEYPNITCQCIDVAAPPSARLIDQLFAEINSASSDTILAYRGNQRWVQIFELAPLESDDKPLRPLRPNGVYLITGGLSGPGQALAHYLAETVQANLVLVAEPGEESLGQADLAALEQRLEAHGAQVLITHAHLVDYSQMRAAVEQAVARFGPIHGVIYAASIAEEKAICTIQETEIIASREHFYKAYGLYALEEALADQTPDFCLLNSSLSTVLGGLGYATYAAADLFMDAFACQRSRASHLPWLSVNWEAWQLEGEAERLLALSAELAQFALTPAEGGQVFHRILAASTASRVIVSTGDLAARMAQVRERAPVQSLALHERPQLQMDYAPPRNETERQVAEIWQQVLGIKQVGIYDNFFDLGGHSLLATQLKNHLYETFKVDMSIRSMFEHATVAGIAELIQQAAASAATHDDKPIAERLRVAFPTERVGVLAEYLKHKVANALNLPIEQLPPDGNLATFDLQTLAADLMWHLKQDFNLQVFPHEVIEHPVLPDLACYLLAELDRMADLTSLATTKPLSAFKLVPYRKRVSVRPARPRPAHKNKPMIFLHSSPRAGSTLFRIMLAGHPQLFCPPELNLLFFADMQEWQQNIGFGHELEWTSAGVQWAFMELMGLETEAGQAWVNKLVEKNESAQSVYARLQELAGRRWLVDKTPTYSMDLETLENAERLFDQPKYLYLFRHPYPVMESLLRIRLDKLFGPSLFEEEDVDPFVVAETVWAISNRNLVQFLERVEPERYLFVRYEDLVSQPAEIMAGVCQFLDISFTEAILNPYDGRRERMMGGLGDPNILQHSSIESSLGEAWKKIKWPRPLDPATLQLAAKLGYKLPASAETPAPPDGQASPEQLLATLDQLSDEQVSAMLNELLAKE